LLFVQECDATEADQGTEAGSIQMQQNFGLCPLKMIRAGEAGTTPFHWNIPVIFDCIVLLCSVGLLFRLVQFEPSILEQVY
jgi:hypothetical protein